MVFQPHGEMYAGRLLATGYCEDENKTNHLNGVLSLDIKIIKHTDKQPVRSHRRTSGNATEHHSGSGCVRMGT